jgi:hypothetical protein
LLRARRAQMSLAAALGMVTDRLGTPRGINGGKSKM